MVKDLYHLHCAPEPKDLHKVLIWRKETMAQLAEFAFHDKQTHFTHIHLLLSEM